MIWSVNSNLANLRPIDPTTQVTPNRRGLRSRELVLDAAERVMADHGFEAATLAHVVEESGVPMSSVYHYYGSKSGILLAVMERGAARFFAELDEARVPRGEPEEHIAGFIAETIRALDRNPNFLRLLIALAAQPPGGDAGEIGAVVGRVRAEALRRLRIRLAIAFDDDRDASDIAQLARFALAAFDGAFVASQADPDVTLSEVLEPLAGALADGRSRSADSRARTASRTA